MPVSTIQPWQDASRPVDERVELLLASMTAEEKAGQLGSRWLGNDLQTEPAPVDDGAGTGWVT